MTVKAAGLNPHSGSHWKRLSRRRLRRLMSLNYIFKCTFSFTLLYFQILQWLLACQNFEDASTRPILSATCVGTSQQFHSVEPSLPSSEPPTFTILTVQLVIRTSLGLHTCYKLCYNGLTAWFNGKKAAFDFAVPMVRREPRNHADDCYFCLTNITGFNASSRKKIKYPNLRSAMRPVPHSDDLPVPRSPVNKDFLSSSDEEIPSREDSAESISLEDIESIYSGTRGNEPHWITQEDLNDLARNLYLLKQQSEVLASRLKQWNLVQEDVRIISFRNRNKDLAFFSTWKTSCATAEGY